MKKLTLLFLFALLVRASVFGQITVDYTNLATVGYRVVEAADTLPSVQPGPAGANQTWNFSGLVLHQRDTMVFTNPNWTPAVADYPGANLCVHWIKSDVYLYLKNDPSGMEVFGQNFDMFNYGSDHSLIFSPSSTFMQWPANYQDNFTDNSGWDQSFFVGQGPTGPDSIRTKSIRSNAVEVDGWGTVTTSLGNFSCLRVRNATTSTDSTWIWRPVGGWKFQASSTKTSAQYTWWSDHAVGRFPLVTVTEDSAGNVVRATWIAEPPEAVDRSEGLSEPELSVFPNPGTGEFFIETTTSGTLMISDLNGKKVLQTTCNAGRQGVSLSQVPPGIYPYSFRPVHSTEITTGKISVQR